MKKWVWLICAILFCAVGVLRIRRYSAGELTGLAPAWILFVGAAVLFAGFVYLLIKDCKASRQAGRAIPTPVQRKEGKQ